MTGILKIKNKSTILLFLVLIGALVLLIDKFNHSNHTDLNGYVVEHVVGNPGETPEVIDGVEIKSEKASSCVASLREVQNLIETNEKRDKDAYTKALKAWQAGKNKLDSDFSTNKKLWSSVCGESSNACGDPDVFFDKKKHIVMDGYDLNGGHFNGSPEECLKRCRDNSTCDFVNWHSGGQCWLKSLNQSHDTNRISGINTSGGWVVKDNKALHGWTINGSKVMSNKSWKSCRDHSVRNGGNAFSMRKNDGFCWVQKIRPNHPNTTWEIGFKKHKTPFKFPEHHSYVTTAIGPMPKESDFRTAVNTGPIICQDCRQAQSKLDVTDSTEIEVDQIQHCIAGIEEREQAKAEAENESQAESQAESQDENKVENKSNMEDSQQVSPSLSNGTIAGIITVVLLFLCMSGIIIFMMGKRRR